MSRPVYTLNLAAIPLFVLAALVALGTFGGTQFQRGALALLVMLASEAVDLKLESRSGSVRALVLVFLPVSLTVLVYGVGLMFAGLA